MYSDWQAEARRVIAKIDAELPPDADLKARRSALRKAAHDFHGGTSHGKKTWGKHCRIYLEKHGQPPRKVERSPRFADDIIFQFRGAE